MQGDAADRHEADREAVQSDEPSMVVGVGGSAGALQALMALLAEVDGDVPMAVVVVLHLAPILQRVSRLRVATLAGTPAR